MAHNFVRCGDEGIDPYRFASIADCFSVLALLKSAIFFLCKVSYAENAVSELLLLFVLFLLLSKLFFSPLLSTSRPQIAFRGTVGALVTPRTLLNA